MKSTFKAIFLVLALLTLTFCGGGGKDTDIEETSRPVASDQTAAQASEETDETFVEEDIVQEIEPPAIKSVTFPESPIAGKDFTVKVELVEPDPDTEIQYRWFVNSKEIPDTNENILTKDYFAGNDWIQCWVTAHRNEKISSLTKSKFIRAKGAIPVIKVTRLEELTIPGTLRYKIEAYDPSIGENIASEENTMKYELLSPLNAGIQMNQETGELSWELDNDKIEKLGEKIEIKFKVSSKQSQTVASSIVLNFKKDPSTQKKSEEQKKIENRSESA